MSRKDRKYWKREKERRPAIRAALPDRLLALAAAGQATGKAAAKAGGRKQKD